MKPLISMRRVVQAGNVLVLDEQNPHIRKQSRWHRPQAGREQRGCTPWTCGCVSMKLVRFAPGKDSEWLECHRQTCKTKDEVLQ